MDTSALENAVPGRSVVEILKNAVRGDFTLDSSQLQMALLEDLMGSVRTLAPRLVRIMGLTVLCAALLQLRTVFGRDEVVRLCELIAYFCMVAPVALDFAALLDLGKTATSSMVAVYEAVLPTMLALLTAMGGQRSVLLAQQTSLTVSGAIASVVNTYLFALLGFCAILAIINRLTENVQLGKLQKFVREFIHWVLGIGFTVFLGLLTMQGLSSSAFDSITLRAAKYAVDNFVPVVGGMFKDTADTLVGCSIIVKNALGLTGLAGIVLVILDPCLSILVTSFGYRLCAAVLQPLGNTKILGALDDFADILTTLFIIIISIGAIFFVFVSSLMLIGGGFI